MHPSSKACLLLSLLLGLAMSMLAQPDDPRQPHYWRSVRPILAKHCYGCHNGEDQKAGINFERYDFIISVVRDGELFHKALEMVAAGSMPPDIRPRMSQEEKDTLTFYINSYLKKALEEKDPGIIPPRRLNNQEYKYAIKDLLGMDIDVDSIFPADPSGGAGFDNQAGVLYLSPLLMERYFQTADFLIEKLYSDTEAWRKRVPAYRPSLAAGIRTLWYRLWHGKDMALQRPQQQAAGVLFPFATLAYRRFLNPQEKQRLLNFFGRVYQQAEARSLKDRFDIAIKESMKLVLVSHHFLFRQEADPPLEGTYPVGNFELASRLSFFLWSSIPDQQLLNVAYREDLHAPEVLEREVARMLRDPRARRMGEQFALQWLELRKLKDPAFQIDPERYPEYSPLLRDLMLREVELFFNHAMLERRNLLDLLDSDYSFMNEHLAHHYGIAGVKGEDMQQVYFTSNSRGGLLGMGGVLTATSLPTRTSPVLRGKWVLEQILGTPAPPPPPDVPELEASHKPGQGELSLRQLLELHRADPACAGCHKAMDPIGLGLENFDGIGRWREQYGQIAIDASGVLKSGEAFSGPAELRCILLAKKELFAKNFSKKMLSYSLGRSLGFKDTPTINHLQQTLLETDFNSLRFIQELVKSFPFRYKKSDNENVLKKVG
ncbi:MAG: DUF1592 domain-containing protein [Bacteroidetes bacterium]|nr:MAG: DUF1592 domain-containing protein [Bacteroidota bacterium]